MSRLSQRVRWRRTLRAMPRSPGPSRPAGAEKLGWRVLAKSRCPPCPDPKGPTRPETQGHSAGGAGHHPQVSLPGPDNAQRSRQPGPWARNGGGWSHCADPAGSVALLLVILLTSGLDSRARLPILAISAPGSSDRSSSARSPQEAPQAQYPPEGSPKCPWSLHPWGPIRGFLA